jgi:hypothetical protein
MLSRLAHGVAATDAAIASVVIMVNSTPSEANVLRIKRLYTKSDTDANGSATLVG